MKSEKKLPVGAKWTFIVLIAASVLVLVKFLNATVPKVSEETSPAHEDESLRSRFYEAPLARVISAAQTVIGKQKTLGKPWKIESYDSSTGDLQQIHAEIPVLLFTDDMTITIHYLGDGDTRVDCFSGSRVSQVDFGQNKRNVTQFLSALDGVLKR